MVERQLVSRNITSEPVLSAMRTVPRHLFVPAFLRDQAYDDRALGLGPGQTISQPYIVALMTQLADIVGKERVLEIANHRMEGERYSLCAASAEKINRTKQAGHRVVAVGSTSTRTLEWIALQKGELVANEGIARLYMKPGDRFRVLDALITNFHLPGSTPLILVAAFAGLDLVRRAYREAIERQYRFYSYGDAMLIL
jgi:hypothetical protein